MRYNQDIEDAIVAQIEREPGRQLILPEWAHYKGQRTPMVYIKGRRLHLDEHLYSKLIAPLPPELHLIPAEGVDPRNINPHLCLVALSRRQRTRCPNGHEYPIESLTEPLRSGWRCRTCYRINFPPRGTPSAAELNRRKTHCPRGHEYSEENTITQGGRRRCRTCKTRQQAEYDKGRRR